eukprot:6175376-Pleurochrysis_carterae.AAC.1
MMIRSKGGAGGSYRNSDHAQIAIRAIQIALHQYNTNSNHYNQHKSIQIASVHRTTDSSKMCMNVARVLAQNEP